MSNAELHNRARSVAPPVKFGSELEGQGGPACDRESLDLRGVGDRHDAWNDWYADARRVGAFQEFPVMAVIKKKLGNDEIQPGIHLAFEVVQIDRRIAAFDMLFGIGGAAETETRATQPADECRQLGGVPESALNGREGRMALRWIPSEREHVLNAACRNLLQDGLQFLTGRTDAGEVSHRLDSGGSLDPRHDFESFFARGAARPVSDGNESRMQRAQLRYGAFQLRGGLVRFRRKELERDRRRSGGKKVPDEHLNRLYRCDDVETVG